MKAKTQLSILLPFCIIFSFSSCKKEAEPIAYVDLERESLTIAIEGGEETVGLKSNGQWTIEGIPDWLTVNPKSGNGTAEITVTADENRDPEARAVSLTFIGKEVQNTLEVVQGGLKGIIRGPTLPIIHLDEASYSFSTDSPYPQLNKYAVKTKSMFVNPAIKDEIYLGNLLCHDAQPHTNIPVFSGYTFNPVTVVDNDVTEETFLPSLAAQEELAKQVIEESNPSAPLTADFGTVEFYDHKQLHVVGMVNMGIKLDEIVSGASFPEKEMTRKFGVIFSFKRILFSLKTDTPQNLIQEELKEADIAKGVSYVSSVSYGKVGLLVVESDIDSRIVRGAIEKVLKNRPVSEQEQNAINSADICYVYFNTNNEAQVNKGGMEAVNAYKSAMRTKDIVYPVQFQLSNFTSHETSSISFSYEMPE
ncbi:MAG: BACON domain-containing protein [Draconibacterium sp.]